MSGVFVRLTTCERLTNRLPNLSLITLGSRYCRGCRNRQGWGQGCSWRYHSGRRWGRHWAAVQAPAGTVAEAVSTMPLGLTSGSRSGTPLWVPSGLPLGMLPDIPRTYTPRWFARRFSGVKPRSIWFISVGRVIRDLSLATQAQTTWSSGKAGVSNSRAGVSTTVSGRWTGWSLLLPSW